MALEKINSFNRWLPPSLWGLVILVLSLMPGGPGNLNLFGIPYFDKIGHFGMYAVWILLFFRALIQEQRMSLQKALWISIGIGAGTGALLEFGQYFMALGRSFELADMLANALGASVGAWAGFFLYTRKKVKRN